MLKFDDVDDGITIDTDTTEPTTGSNKKDSFEEDKPAAIDDNKVEDVRTFTTDTEIEEIMDGICPEDLSFNTSCIGLTTPLKNTENVIPQPLHASTPNVNPSDKNNTSSSPVRDTVRVSSTTPNSKISKSVVEKVNKVLGPDFKGFKSSSEIKNISLTQCDHLTVYPEGTFYGLSEGVLKCLKEFKGINKLYG